MSTYFLTKTKRFSVFEVSTDQNEEKTVEKPSIISIQYGKKISLEDFTSVAVKESPVIVDAVSLERLQNDFDAFSSRLKNDVFMDDLQVRRPNQDEAPYDMTVSRAALLMGIIKIIHGRFKVRPSIVQLLIEMLNKNVLPVLHSSMNAGVELVDIINESAIHMCFTPKGLLRSDKAFKYFDIQLIPLNNDEVSFFVKNEFVTAASATMFVTGAWNIVSTLDVIASLSCEAGAVNISAFDASQYEEFRQHRGQITSLANIRFMLEGSKRCTFTSVDGLISLRHIPQVHGPVNDTLQICRKFIEQELITLSYSERLNPTQFVLTMRNAYDALWIAFSASNQRKKELLGKAKPCDYCIETDFNEKHPIEFLLKVCTGFIDEIETSLHILRKIEDATNRASNPSREEKKIDYTSKKQSNTNENLTAAQKAKIESKRRMKEDKAREKAENKAFKKFGIALGIGSNSARKFIVNFLACTFSPILDPFDVKKHSFVSFCQSLLDNLNSGGKRQLRIPKGTRDFTPDQMKIRERVFGVIKNVFKRHGAVEIDTPVFEVKEILTGKYGEDSKLIYDLADQGGDMLSLRYDLTVPFARFLAMNSVGNIKRYHIAKVYRRDNPVVSKGRYREFYQCDFDIAGTFTRMVPDAEVITIAIEILSSLPIGEFCIKLNHRKLLDAIFEIAGVPPEKFRPICSAVDKLDKLPWIDVKTEMVGEKGLSESAADIIGHFVKNRGKPYDLLSKLMTEDAFGGHDSALNALKDLETLFGYLGAMGSLQYLSFDMSLARGLDYYTGVIYEAVLTDGLDEMGSIAAGGRYDNLVSMFSPSSEETPCVGVSIGVERVFTLMEKKMAIMGLPQTSNIQVFIASIGKGYISRRMALARVLWKANISAEYSHLENPKFKKQLDEALVRRIPFMVIFGEEEVSNNVVIVKNMERKEEFKVSESEVVSTLLSSGCVPLTENGHDLPWNC